MKLERTPDGARPLSNGGVGGVLPVGTRVRFTRTLTSAADEFSPGNLYAKKGELGTITGHGAPEGYWVKWDGWMHAAFGASREEIEPAEQNAQKHICCG